MTTKSGGALRAVLLALAANAVAAFGPCVCATSSVARHRPRQPGVVASFALPLPGDGACAGQLRDALMHRTVELQVNAFAVVRDIAPKQYLTHRWAHFLDTRVSIGCGRNRPTNAALSPACLARPAKRMPASRLPASPLPPAPLPASPLPASRVPKTNAALSPACLSPACLSPVSLPLPNPPRTHGLAPA